MIARLFRGRANRSKQQGRKKAKATCELCYFRQAGLCALPESPCPTYRPVGRGTLSPPHQARLIPRVARSTRRISIAARFTGKPRFLRARS